MNEFGFTPEEEIAHRLLQTRMRNNPRLQKQVIKRIRRMQRAQGMAPSIKTKK